MTSRKTLLVGLMLAALTVGVCWRDAVWERALRMDNRFYFYVAERAASGVPPHVSTPDVKNQLSALVDATAIRLGRLAGFGDVRSGRIGSVGILVAGVWGVGFSLLRLGVLPMAALFGSLSVLALSGLVGHAVVGFNPKLLLFSLLTWVPFLVAGGRFAAAGATATAAMMCWQPAVVACVAVAVAALTIEGRARHLGRCLAGGVATFVLYELYFAWHGALGPQLFQSYILPLGSAHQEINWARGVEFVFTGSGQGLDRIGLPAVAFAVFVVGAIVARLRSGSRVADRDRSLTPAVVAVAVGGSLACLFTAYEHQAEPDRFLLCAYFALAIGLVLDRVLRASRHFFGARTTFRLEGVLFAALVTLPFGKGVHNVADKDSLDTQLEAGRILAMYAEAYGSIWTFGGHHMLAAAHLTSFHPFDHQWDDLRRYASDDEMLPIVHGKPPNLILALRRPPLPANFLSQYREVVVLPLNLENLRLWVRTDVRIAGPLATAPLGDRKKKALEKKGRGSRKQKVAPKKPRETGRAARPVRASPSRIEIE